MKPKRKNTCTVAEDSTAETCANMDPQTYGLTPFIYSFDIVQYVQFGQLYDPRLSMVLA